MEKVIKEQLKCGCFLVLEELFFLLYRTKLQLKALRTGGGGGFGIAVVLPRGYLKGAFAIAPVWGTQHYNNVLVIITYDSYHKQTKPQDGFGSK